MAGRNIDRYEATGKLDLSYLQSLSADAAPVIADRLPADAAACALRYLPDNQLSEDNDDALGWNLGSVAGRGRGGGPGHWTRTSARPRAGDPCGPIIDAYAAGTAG